MLYAGKGVKDVYKTAVIDTIVAEVQSVPGEDRCVLLLGYKEQMEEMFQVRGPTSRGHILFYLTDRHRRTSTRDCPDDSRSRTRSSLKTTTTASF